MCSSPFLGLTTILLQEKQIELFFSSNTLWLVDACVLLSLKRQRECTGIALLLVVVVEHFESLQATRPLLPSVYWCASELISEVLHLLFLRKNNSVALN